MSERPKGPESRLFSLSTLIASKEKGVRESEKKEQKKGRLVSEGFSIQRREGKANEDSFVNVLSYEERSGLFAVADGIGGDAGGAEASKTVKEIVEKYFSKMAELLRRRAAGADTAPIEMAGALLRRSIREANARIILKREEMPVFRNMGTTCVAARVTRDAEGNAFGIIAHAGDSRAYAYFPDGRLETLTLDDHLSFLVTKKHHGEEAALRVQDILDNALSREQMEMMIEEVKDGNDIPDTLSFTKEDVRFLIDHMEPKWLDYYYNKRGQVFGSVGHEPEVKIKIVYLPPGSQLILASDGLDGLLKKEVRLIVSRKYNQLPYDAVKEAALDSKGDTAQVLVTAAKRRQGEWKVHPHSRGQDDTTVVAVRIT